MHQAHTIPWQTLTSHFIFVRDNPRRTPHTTDIFPIHPPRPTRTGDLTHFTRVLANTIRSFSRTERGKHPSAEELRLQVTCNRDSNATGNSTNIVSKATKETSINSTSSSSPPKLFHDALLTRYPQYLTANMQNPMYWGYRARRWLSGSDASEWPRYSTSDGDLADAIKVLMYATDSRGVLCLAHLPREIKTRNLAGSNPDVVSTTAPLHSPIYTGPALRTLSELGWGHSFGFNRIVDGALWAYIYLNLSVALDLVSSGTFMETCNFAMMFRETTDEKDYCAQQLPHRAFWEHMGISSVRENPEGFSRSNMFSIYVPKARPWTGTDLEWMERYLKELFRLLYVYDMVMSECGVEVRWEREIIFTVRRITQASTQISMKDYVEFM